MSIAEADLVGKMRCISMRQEPGTRAAVLSSMR